MKQLSEGLLICIEGIDGSGKSSFSKSLSEELIRQGYQTILTREPGGTPLGERVRDVLFDGKTPPTPKAEFLLFAASRAQHCEEHIKPALAAGTIVLSDRMADSSLVYQGYIRNLSLDTIRLINSWAMDTVQPTLIFYLHISAATAFERIKARNVQGAAFEENLTYLQRALHGFENLVAHRPEVIILDAHQPADIVYKQGLKALKTYVPGLELP